MTRRPLPDGRADIRSALRTVLTLWPGIGQEQATWDLAELGLDAPDRHDLRAIGGAEVGLGVWEVGADYRSCTDAERWARGEALCALSYEYRVACPEWRRRRAEMVAWWVREDAKVVRLRRAA